MAARYAIYLLRNGEQLGPFTKAELSRRLATRDIPADCLAWHDKLVDWTPIPDIFPGEELSARIRGSIEPATEKQLAYLADLGAHIPNGISKSDASDLIDSTLRAMHGVTDNQKRRLKFYGIPVTDGMTKLEASDLIDEYIAAHPESEEKYQAWKAIVVGGNEADERQAFLDSLKGAGRPVVIRGADSVSRTSGLVVLIRILLILITLGLLALVLF